MAVQFLLQKSYSLDDFARHNDIGLTTVRGEIRSGRLVARKIGRRTIITPEDANDWRNRLPKSEAASSRGMSEKDIPAVFRWETPWRPNEIEELQANPGLRSGRTRDVNIVMGFVLGQALKTYRADPNQWISYSRNQDWYRDPGRRQYFPVRTPYASVRSAIDQLAAIGAIEHRKSPPGNLGQQSSFRGTADLYLVYTERPVPLVCTPRERIILRDGDGKLAPYQNSRDTHRWRKQVLAFNEMLSSASIEFDGKLIQRATRFGFGMRTAPTEWSTALPH
jgi:hypothetical protein